MKNGHRAHTIADSVKIAFLDETENNAGVLKITGADGTKTLISLLRPTPASFGHAFAEITVGL